MGAGCSGKAVSNTASDQVIDKALAAQKEDKVKDIKLVLLGAGGCGKSTILKQMKLLHLNGFSETDKANQRDLVHRNTVQAMQQLCAAVTELEIGFQNEGSAEKSQRILAVNVHDVIDTEATKEDLMDLWKDPGVQTAVTKDSKFDFLDSGPYFLDKVKDTFLPDYMPDEADMLRTRLSTTGIISTQFSLDGLDFFMYDVGGQRGERKKWIHCFGDVTAILFIASLSEYNQRLAEDRKKNRMRESMQLFESIVGLKWFKDTKVILFLNKKDLFAEKIQRIDMGRYFKKYTGGKDYEAALSWIKGEFDDRNFVEGRQIYTHVTDATNTENIRFVWKATNHILLSQNLRASGLSMG